MCYLLFSVYDQQCGPGWPPKYPPCCGSLHTCQAWQALTALAWSLSGRTLASLATGYLQCIEGKPCTLVRPNPGTIGKVWRFHSLIKIYAILMISVGTWTGSTTRALTLGTILPLRAWTMGRTNARVLPLPVGAETQTSWGLNIERAWSWNEHLLTLSIFFTSKCFISCQLQFGRKFKQMLSKYPA